MNMQSSHTENESINLWVIKLKSMHSHLWIPCIDSRTRESGCVLPKGEESTRFGRRNPLVGHFHPLIFVIKRNCRVLYLRC